MTRPHQLVPALPDGTDGQMPGHEQYVLGTLALMQREVGRHSVEIGTFTGATTTTIARATGHVVYTVDIPLGEPTKWKLGADNQKYIGRTPAFGADVKGRIIAIRCDSAYLALPHSLAVGFAFIDGAHTYEYCWNDFLKVEPLLVDGAVVLFHDVGVWPGVGEAVDEIVKRHAGWQWSAYGGTSLVWGRKR